MPTWVLWLAAAATALTSLGVIWTKFLNPLRLAVNMALGTFPVVIDMAEQFRTDGGSSLRDVVNDLTTALEDIKRDRAQVAIDLAAATRKIEEVAVELEAARSRADTVGPTHTPGAAADAAARHDPNDREAPNA